MEVIFLAISNLIFLVLGYFLCYLMIPKDKKDIINIPIKTKHEELEEAYIPEEE